MSEESERNFDERLEQLQADGTISVDDADEVRTFASFLRAVQGIPTKPGEATKEESKRFAEAYREHYPEEFETQVAKFRTESAEKGQS